jgi:hypothetical protein
VDFDGVLHSYASGWKGAANIPDPPFPGAMDFLREMTQHFRTDIFSSRSNMEGGIPAMIGWIERNALLEHGAGGIGWVSQLVYPTVKPPARVSLDDRAITFTGRWPTVAELRDFKPWYMKG